MDTNTLAKVDKMPDWVADLFKKIDKKDFAGAKAYMADDIELYFAHFQLRGLDQFLKVVGAFDNQFPEYHHLINEVWDGPELVMFGGTLQMQLEDGSIIETPFWNRFYKSLDGQHKFVKAFAMFSMGAFPPKYWQHLSMTAQPQP